MSNPEIAISVEHLSKEFRIGKSSPYGRFSEVVQNTLLSPFKRNPQKKAAQEKFLALDDINFEVKQGEILGIIGRNGAGKSTLLKILSRITPPSSGRFGIRGRVGSLLEVGTGFHPELTGRENVFLNGTIIGMKRSEIARRFDEIVAFAEVEKFIDTPVKHYSSGMYMRLAFAVAAHLDPEILIVDEVLAVGDAGFQKKCLTSMKQLSVGYGRTIIFVSHNPSALATLCTRGIFLDKGKLVYYGSIQDAIALILEQDETRKNQWEGPSGDEYTRLLSAKVSPLESGDWDTGCSLIIEAKVEILQPLEGFVFGFRLFSSYGYELAYSLYDDADPPRAVIVNPCIIVQKWIIPGHTLAQGKYVIAFELGLAFKKISHRTDYGELEFELQNLTGQGRRFTVNTIKGFDSLFRPKWTAEREVVSLDSNV
jgi:lipopolysaccharide transport system ATP-binding protein